METESPSTPCNPNTEASQPLGPEEARELSTSIPGISQVDFVLGDWVTGHRKTIKSMSLLAKDMLGP